MPIRPEDLDRYPDDWTEIRARIQARAANCCEFCGVKNWSIGGRVKDGNFLPLFQPKEDPVEARQRLGQLAWCGKSGPDELLRVIRIVCTTAHLDHVPENCSDENLRFLCQRCHLHYDRLHHAETAYRTRREGKAAGDLFDAEASAA